VTYTNPESGAVITGQEYSVGFYQKDYDVVSWMLYESGAFIRSGNSYTHTEDITKYTSGNYSYYWVINNYCTTNYQTVSVYAPVSSGQWNDVRTDSEIEINSSGTKIFYINTNLKVTNLWKSGSTWYDAVLNSSSVSAENGRGLVYNSSLDDVYYVGSNNKIYQLYYNSGWLNSQLCPSQWNYVHSNSELEIDEYGSKVFYINTNRDVCVLYKSGSIWYDSKLKETGMKAENGRGLVYNKNNGEVYYTGDDNKIYRYYYNNGVWNSAVLMSGQWYLTRWESELELNSTGDKIFYINYSGQVCNLYKSGSYWYEGVLNTSAPLQKTGSNFTWHNDNLIYIGSDNKIYKLYYSSGWNWALIESRELESESNIACYNGNVYFSEKNTDHIFNYNLSTSKSAMVEEKSGKKDLYEISELSDISIYPNPSDGIIQIKNIEEKSFIKIYDSMGKLIYKTEYLNNNIIDIADKPKGLYFVVIIKNNIRTTHKLVLN